MRKHLVLIAALMPSLMVGACAGTKNRGLESVHQPVVARNDYVFDVATSGNGLAPGEAARLTGWMSSLHVGYGDQVAIDDPSPYNNGTHAEIAAQVARYGLLLNENAPITDSPVTPGTVRVVVSRMKATVPGCPDFSRARQPEFESNTSSNHGCSINSNLASMIANPVDLVRGQTGYGVTDQAQSTKAIESFRKATPTGAGGLKSESK